MRALIRFRKTFSKFWPLGRGESGQKEALEAPMLDLVSYYLLDSQIGIRT